MKERKVFMCLWTWPNRFESTVATTEFCSIVSSIDYIIHVRVYTYSMYIILVRCINDYRKQIINSKCYSKTKPSSITNFHMRFELWICHIRFNKLTKYDPMSIAFDIGRLNGVYLIRMAFNIYIIAVCQHNI